jgi:hypothetical protein
MVSFCFVLFQTTLIIIGLCAMLYTTTPQRRQNKPTTFCSVHVGEDALVVG